MEGKYGEKWEKEANQKKTAHIYVVFPRSHSKNISVWPNSNEQGLHCNYETKWGEGPTFSLTWSNVEGFRSEAPHPDLGQGVAVQRP